MSHESLKVIFTYVKHGRDFSIFVRNLFCRTVSARNVADTASDGSIKDLIHERVAQEIQLHFGRAEKGVKGNARKRHVVERVELELGKVLLSELHDAFWGEGGTKEKPR